MIDKKWEKYRGRKVRLIASGNVFYGFVDAIESPEDSEDGHLYVDVNVSKPKGFGILGARDDEIEEITILD